MTSLHVLRELGARCSLWQWYEAMLTLEAFSRTMSKIRVRDLQDLTRIWQVNPEKKDLNRAEFLKFWSW